MLYYPISALINAIASTIVCFVAITRNYKSELNRSFGFFAFSVAFWAYCYFLWQVSTSAESALFWCRALMAGAIFIPSTFLHFSLTFVDRREKYSKIIAFWYLANSVGHFENPFSATLWGYFLFFLIYASVIEEGTKFLLIKRNVGQFPYGFLLGLGFGIGETVLRYPFSEFGPAPGRRSA